MKREKTVLIVDDEKKERQYLEEVLGDTYEILKAENGREAIAVLEKEHEKISAILIDLIMPEFDGIRFMEYYSKSVVFGMIPVIIATTEGDSETEKKCLKLGVWDFVGKPYDASMIQFRLKNVIERSENLVSKGLCRRAPYDQETDIYSMSMFYYVTRKMFARYPGQKFAMIRMDIGKFRLVNAFFGRKEGDRLLTYMSQYLLGLNCNDRPITFGYMGADVFSVCCAYNETEEIMQFMRAANKHIAAYPLEFDLELTYGIYLIDDYSYNVSEMYEFANQAAKNCKEEYNIKNYAFYEPKMQEEIIKEQMIINNMRRALHENEFVLYLQPKYELQTSTLAGAEVLVRWQDPKRGMISPGEFIPIFERNGFIMKLDFYIWEQSCQLIRKWLDEGREPLPVSVNISRVSLYNPRLAEVLCGLIEKYQIPPELFQLELTESAYTTNQNSIRGMMTELQRKGFTIMMDDFGSGYSSLNVLKDIKVDVLKIDMKFLSDTEDVTRSENILAAVVRMAKWIHVPVIAEGVETKEQALFLKSIGCEYVQGYYYAKPMPVEDYEELAFLQRKIEPGVSGVSHKESEELLSKNSQLELLFSNMQQAVVVYEYGEGSLDILRVNDAYYHLFGFEDINNIQKSLDLSLSAGNREILRKAFEETVRSRDGGECEVLRQVRDRSIWLSVKLKYISPVGKRHLIYGYMNDVTVRKRMDMELQKYRRALTRIENEEETILIVDDQEVNRVSLRCMFEEKYHILEAENGLEALRVLEKQKEHVDMILLDLYMPELDGEAFLAYRSSVPELAEIPVVIITADDTTEQQIDTMRMGADEYIVKPFIPEIVVRRVENVMNSSRSIRKVSQEKK